MTTVLDPLSSPEVFYNKSGKSIQVITVDSTTQTPIVSVSGETHVIAGYNETGPYPGGDDGLILPSDAEIGDLVSVWLSGTWPVNVFAPSGEDIAGYLNVQVNNPPSGVTFMKYSTSSWVCSSR